MPHSPKVVNRFVWLTGRVSPSAADLARAESVLRHGRESGFDPKAMLEVSLTQGVVPQVCRSAERLERSGHPALERFLAQARDYLASHQSYIDRLLRDLSAFTVEARAAGIRFLAVKGTAVMHRYPSESKRLMRDVDLLVEARSGWDAMRVVEGLGYQVRRVRLERFPYAALGPGLYGIAETVDDQFDLHFGAFPGCGDSVLEADLWGRAEANGVGVPVPSVEDCLLVLATHLTRHGSVKLRDLNDVYVCVTGEHEIDWEYLHRTAAANDLESVVYSLLSTVEREYGLDGLADVTRRFRPSQAWQILSRRLVRIGDRDDDFEFASNKLFVGRLMQAAFLFRYYRRRAGLVRAARLAAGGLYRLVRTGRPYPLWPGRQVRDLAVDGRLVAVPLRVRPEWDGVSLDAVADLAHARGIPARELAYEVLAWNAGTEDELLVTPLGILTQSPYRGELSAGDLARAGSRAAKLAADVRAAGRPAAR